MFMTTLPLKEFSVSFVPAKMFSQPSTRACDTYTLTPPAPLSITFGAIALTHSSSLHLLTPPFICMAPAASLAGAHSGEQLEAA